jgi:hypothetical protein
VVSSPDTPCRIEPVAGDLISLARSLGRKVQRGFVF